MVYKDSMLASFPEQGKSEANMSVIVKVNIRVNLVV